MPPVRGAPSRASVIALVLAACAHVPAIPPAERTAGDEYALAVALEVLCVAPEPLLRDPAPVFSSQPWVATGKLGSGVLVDGRHALTAAHVVECPFLPIVRMTRADGAAYRMAVEWDDPTKDLARLVIASADVLHVVPPVIAEPAIGGVVCAAVTFPARQLNCGELERRLERPRANLAITALVEGGNSGAGVYDNRGRLVNSGAGVYDNRGRLVGIVSSVAQDRTMGYATELAGTRAWR